MSEVHALRFNGSSLTAKERSRTAPARAIKQEAPVPELACTARQGASAPAS